MTHCAAITIPGSTTRLDEARTDAARALIQHDPAEASALFRRERLGMSMMATKNHLESGSDPIDLLESVMSAADIVPGLEALEDEAENAPAWEGHDTGSPLAAALDRLENAKDCVVADRLMRSLAPETLPLASSRHEVLELVEDIHEMLARNCTARALLAPLNELHEMLFSLAASGDRGGYQLESGGHFRSSGGLSQHSVVGLC